MQLKNQDDCEKEWITLTNEHQSLEETYKSYIDHLKQMTELQACCAKAIYHQRYRMNIVAMSAKRFSSASDGYVEHLQRRIVQRKAEIYDMENFLPKENDHYLQIILGSVNVSILNKHDRFLYKEEYEKFKLLMNAISMGISFFNLLVQNRIVDLIFMFMLVWYYCTLTIRESILRVNGSRIKGWWRAHHFVSCVLSAILLVWPVGPVYYMFRPQFHWFNVYISSVQYMQFVYQRGCLYRLKALGERRDMDITVEGFHSWMWRGLSFLLPFLFVAYSFEFYNAYSLYKLSSHPDATWQVSVLSGLFLLLAIGNSFTTLLVFRQKLKESWKLKYRFGNFDYMSHNFQSFVSPSCDRHPLATSQPGDDCTSKDADVSKSKLQ